MKWSRRLTIFLVISALLAAGIWWIKYSMRQRWTSQTTPLPNETVQELCRGLGLQRDHRLCSGRSPVYAPDFGDVIRLQLHAFGQTGDDRATAATYDTVEQQLGAYRYECDEKLSRGTDFSFFACYYDLRGDRKYPLVVLFSSPDERVWQVFGSLDEY